MDAFNIFCRFNGIIMYIINGLTKLLMFSIALQKLYFIVDSEDVKY